MVYNILVKYKVFFQILPEKKRLIWGANHFVTFIRVFWVAEHHPGSTHLPSAQDLLQVFLCHTIGVVGTECLQCIFFIVCLKISNSFSGLDNKIMMVLWMLSASSVLLFVFFSISFLWIFLGPHASAYRSQLEEEQGSHRQFHVLRPSLLLGLQSPCCSCELWQASESFLGTVSTQSESRQKEAKKTHWDLNKAGKARDSIVPQ